jgi:hypothetical protein
MMDDDDADDGELPMFVCTWTPLNSAWILVSGIDLNVVTINLITNCSYMIRIIIYCALQGDTIHRSSKLILVEPKQD